MSKTISELLDGATADGADFVEIERPAPNASLKLTLAQISILINSLLPVSSALQKGIVELLTAAEVTTGTDTTRAMTAAALFNSLPKFLNAVKIAGDVIPGAVDLTEDVTEAKRIKFQNPANSIGWHIRQRSDILGGFNIMRSDGAGVFVANSLEIDGSDNVALVGGLTCIDLFAEDGDFTGDVKVSGFLNVGVPSELTIAAGVVTATQTRHDIDTESNDATDNLDTINGGVDGHIIILTAKSSAREVILKHDIGNLFLEDEVDFRLDSRADTITLMFQGALSAWVQQSSSNNA